MLYTLIANLPYSFYSNTKIKIPKKLSLLAGATLLLRKLLRKHNTSFCNNILDIRSQDVRETYLTRNLWETYTTLVYIMAVKLIRKPQNSNVTHYLCYSTFIHKSDPSPSRVYCIFAKSTNSNFQFTYCSSHGQVTFLKHCYWLVGQKHNTHVTVKDQIYQICRKCLREPTECLTLSQSLK